MITIIIQTRKSGFFQKSSPRMHPQLQTSIAGPYLSSPSSSSGGRYHNVITLLVYGRWRSSALYNRASPKSANLTSPLEARAIKNKPHDQEKLILTLAVTLCWRINEANNARLSVQQTISQHFFHAMYQDNLHIEKILSNNYRCWHVGYFWADKKFNKKINFSTQVLKTLMLVIYCDMII